MTSTPDPTEGARPAQATAPVDERLLAAHDLARAALTEVTPAETIGDPAGYTVEDGGVVSLRFATRLAGYPQWFWTVSVAVVEGADPTVLEVELLPGEGALLAPEWVPWAERLAEYQAAQAALAEAEGGDDPLDDADQDDDEDADEDLSDLDDLDTADFDEDGSPLLHSGDVDGVDIDELDEDSSEDEDSLEDEDSSDDEDSIEDEDSSEED
ncbi:DUF3027 domain-containing protein [Microbacterium sp.]|uniref:DUF3027 domain-containing protein n=1 Tax=Microbacterium sp. TaxID=51671 RepID=UPI0039E6F922